MTAQSSQRVMELIKEYVRLTHREESLGSGHGARSVEIRRELVRLYSRECAD